jgi:hypothetical protein
MTRAALDRLAAFQREFSSMLQTPLDRSTGTLRSIPDTYPAALRARVDANGVPSDERLAVYHRQYWFRLFGVLHASYPLTTALLGAWQFNELAARYLEAHPPVGHELSTISDGLVAFARERIHEVSRPAPPEALVEAVEIDGAFHVAKTAPVSQPLRLDARDAGSLATGRLVRAPAFSIISEGRPLVALHHELPSPIGEYRAKIPSAYPDGRRWWLIGRTLEGIRALPLVPAQAELFEELKHRPLGEALARLEARHGDVVAGNVQRWLAHAMALGLWTSLEPAP